MVATSWFNELQVALPHVIECYPVLFLRERARLSNVQLVFVFAVDTAIFIFGGFVAPTSVVEGSCVVDLYFQLMFVMMISGDVHSANCNDDSDDSSSEDDGKDCLAEASVASTHG